MASAAELASTFKSLLNPEANLQQLYQVQSAIRLTLAGAERRTRMAMLAMLTMLTMLTMAMLTMAMLTMLTMLTTGVVRRRSCACGC